MTLRTRKAPRVRQDGNNLVAAYHTANPPLIWKFDLERNHSFSLALQGEEGDWELGVTSPKEEFHPVARFLSREDAEEAFTKTQDALLKTRFNKWKPIAIILGIMLLCMFFFGLLPYQVAYRKAEMAKQHANGSKTTEEQSATVPDGTPLSADQVLKPPQ